MTTEKFIAFVNKLLLQTKDETIHWERYVPVGANDWASQLKSFTCTAGSMRIYLLSDDESDNIEFLIRYDSSLPMTSLEPASDRERQISLRLVNYIYNQFPNLEKSIDEFLNAP